MTSPHEAWPNRPGHAGPGESWHPDPTQGALPDAPPAPESVFFPQTGWSATVVDPSGTTWRNADGPQPGPSYEWSAPLWPSGSPAAAPAATPPASAPVEALGARPEPRRAALGVAAFTVVTSMTLACVTFAYLVGRGVGSTMLAFSTPVFDPLEVARALPMSSDGLSALVVLGFLASLVGVGGLVMAITARLRRSAPTLSLTAVIVGLCSPMLAFIALLAATEPFIHQLS